MVLTWHEVYVYMFLSYYWAIMCIDRNTQKINGAVKIELDRAFACFFAMN